jgi:RalA-binding protein 1
MGIGMSIHESPDRLQSHSHSSVKIENLVERNANFEKRLNEKGILIAALRSHISLLEKRLQSNGLEVPQFTEPPAPRDVNPNQLTVDVSRAKSLDQLQLPPRSADRLRTSPLKSPNFERSTQVHGSPPPLRSLAKEGYKNDSSGDDAKQKNVMVNARSSPKRPISFEQEDSTLTGLDTSIMEPETNNTVVTPVKTKPVDWDATIEALKASSEAAEALKDDLKTVKQKTQTQTQGTPYSGRINTQSPLRSTKSSNYSQSPAPSGMDSSQTSFVIANPYQENVDDSGLSVAETPKSMTQVSPLKLPRHTPGRLPENLSPVPMDLLVSDAQLNLKSNLNVPHAGNFQHQQIQQDKIGLGGPYSTPHTPQRATYEPVQPLPVSHQQKVQTQIQFPTDVPLFVDPGYLSTVKPEVVSTVDGNPSKKTDNPTILVAAVDRQTNKEMWRFKKTLSQLVALDNEIRPMINTFSLPPVPDKGLFLTNIPSKVDMRRLRIRDYFATLFTIPNIPMNAAYQISRFMSLDVVNLLDESNIEALKEGWLLRRSKGLGNNWRARYCVVEGSMLKVLDSQDGPLLEIIKLGNCQIGRQPDSKLSDDKTAYRHAFAVMEPKKGLKAAGRHIFCAETDSERDEWINVLVQLLDDTGNSIYSAESSTLSSVSHLGHLDSTLSASASTVNSPARTLTSLQDVDEETLAREAKRNKKRSFFPFSKKMTTEDTPEAQSTSDFNNIENALQEMNLGQASINKGTVFQNELSQVVLLSSHELYGVTVPSILYRCLQLLIDKSAIYEEGLFRLSGSSLLIRQLREQFDKNRDLDFENLENTPDINTVAGLLKLWLRELPSNILTKEIYPSFKETSMKSDPVEVSREFLRLSKTLPEVNYNILFALFKFLHDVIKNQDLNKMNLRNLCIVFSPTLNVASEVIIPFLVDYKFIFENGTPVSATEREVLDLNIPTF